jgi:hypothetical protein
VAGRDGGVAAGCVLADTPEPEFGPPEHSLNRAHSFASHTHPPTSTHSRVAQASYEMPVGVVISDPREAFVLKSGQWRPATRLILNARRMSFDLPPAALAAVEGSTPSDLSERALRLVYDLSPDSGTERLVAFLDLCSAFRAFPLHRLDPASDDALAFWLNLHHTLLQHALLLLGPPSSKDWASFFAGVSYEIGADVFSLAEIEHCVLRGKLSRPRSVPRYLPAPPPPEDDHYRHALTRCDFRINFALTTGSVSAPPFVTVFRAGPGLEAQLDRASVRYLDYTLKLDSKKRMIVLPKVCDVYRRDFSPLERSMATVRHETECVVGVEWWEWWGGRGDAWGDFVDRYIRLRRSHDLPPPPPPRRHRWATGQGPAPLPGPGQAGAHRVGAGGGQAACDQVPERQGLLPRDAQPHRGACDNVVGGKGRVVCGLFGLGAGCCLFFALDAVFWGRGRGGGVPLLKTFVWLLGCLCSP